MYVSVVATPTQRMPKRTWRTADDTSTAVGSEVAFVTDTDESLGANVGVADWARKMSG